MNKILRILPLSLLLVSAVVAEETAPVEAVAPVEVVETEVSVSETTLEAKIRAAIVKIVASQDEVKLSDDQVSKLVEGYVKDLKDKTDEEQSKFIASIDTVSLTVTTA